VLIRLLQRLFPGRCGNGRWWDPAVCYRPSCKVDRVEIVTVDHNGDIFEMACSPEHYKPMGRWTGVVLDEPVVGGTWRQVEREVQAALADCTRPAGRS
jgi:hypothetical protein